MDRLTRRIAATQSLPFGQSQDTTASNKTGIQFKFNLNCAARGANCL